MIENCEKLAEQLYPERPIYLPDGGAVVVVPVPERRAFVRGAAWQAAQVLPVLEPFAREADALSLSGALGHIQRAHLMAARDLVAHLRRAEEPTDARPDDGDG